MLEVLPLIDHVTLWVLPAVQFSPPLGEVTVTTCPFSFPVCKHAKKRSRQKILWIAQTDTPPTSAPGEQLSLPAAVKNRKNVPTNPLIKKSLPFVPEFQLATSVAD